MERPPDETWEWVKTTLAAPEIAGQTGHDHGYSNLWRIRSTDRYYWLKMHAYPVKWAGEVHALTTWTPPLGKTPSVIASQRDPNAVILSEAPGKDAESVNLSPKEEERLWSEAGAWLGKLHNLTNGWFGTIQPDGTPCESPSTAPEAFVAAPFEQRLREGKEMELLDAKTVEFVRLRMKEWLPAFRDEPPRAIHRDYSPRNWLVGEEGELTAVIDFEHARWDVRTADLNRWWDHEFLSRPHLRDLFFDAYGPVDERLNTQLALARLMNALGGYVWGTKVKDTAFASRNHEALLRIMRDPKLPFDKLP